jgi:hypothetical protein
MIWRWSQRRSFEHQERPSFNQNQSPNAWRGRECLPLIIFSSAKTQLENIEQPTFNIDHRIIPSLVHHFSVGRSMFLYNRASRSRVSGVAANIHGSVTKSSGHCPNQ